MRVYTTIAHDPIPSLLQNGHHRPHLRQRWAVDRDGISKEVNHRRGCGSTQYVYCCRRAIFSTHKVINTRERSIPLPLELGRVGTHFTLAESFGGLKGRGRRYKIRHAGRSTCGPHWQGLHDTVSINQFLHAKTVKKWQLILKYFSPGSPVNKIYVHSSGPANPACNDPHCV